MISIAFVGHFVFALNSFGEPSLFGDISFPGFRTPLAKVRVEFRCPDGHIRIGFGALGEKPCNEILFGTV
jgi:hypothetical protein